MKNKPKECLICQRISLIRENKNPFFIKKFKTGYAVLGDSQFQRGYCLFLCKDHKKELHELGKDFRLKFLEEMSEFAEVVFKTFEPDKLNYELLGNQDQHLHWHIFPRYKKEKYFNQPIWQVNKRIRNAKKYIPGPEQIKENILKLKN